VASSTFLKAWSKGEGVGLFDMVFPRWRLRNKILEYMLFW